MSRINFNPNPIAFQILTSDRCRSTAQKGVQNSTVFRCKETNQVFHEGDRFDGHVIIALLFSFAGFGNQEDRVHFGGQ